MQLTLTDHERHELRHLYVEPQDLVERLLGQLEPTAKR